MLLKDLLTYLLITNLYTNGLRKLANLRHSKQVGTRPGGHCG